MKLPRSLRGQLFAWLLAPLALLALADAFTSYRNAVATATLVQERMLLGAARVIGEQARLEDGVLQVVVPPAALELFASPSHDRVFYRATDDDGTLLTGYYDLGDPPRRPALEESLYFDARMRDRPVHAVAYAQPLLGVPGHRSVLVEVAQTLEGRDALARQMWLAAVRRQSALLLVGVLLWLGLRQGLRPVTALRDRMLARSPGSTERLDERAVPQELQPLVAAVNDYAARLDHQMSAHSRFIANASHQLRTPLTVLNTQVDYALRTPEAREESLRAIQRNVQHGMRLVRQLLAFSTAEAATATPPPAEPTDLLVLATESVERASGLAMERGIDLGLEAEGSPAVVTGLPALLGELLANLVDNALRYTPAGGVVTVGVRAQAGRIVLEVLDSGPGIAPDQRELVFERFRRLGNTRSDGCGLGLPIVREIAQLHGVAVELSDGPQGRGLAVRLRFPPLSEPR